MASNRLTFQMVGPDEENGDVRFDDFLKQFDAVKRALTETGRILAVNDAVYYRVVGLSHSSPATVELEAVSTVYGGLEGIVVCDRFIEGIVQIQEKGTAPSEFDYEALQAYKSLSRLVGTRLPEFRVSHNGTNISVSPTLAHNVEVILGPDRFEIGSRTGTLDAINVHEGNNAFVIYSTARLPRLRCEFPPELRKDAISAIGQYVTVYGRLKYKRRNPHPYEMSVTRIEPHPEESELPTLAQLRGILSRKTDQTSAEQTIRDLRDEW